MAHFFILIGSLVFCSFNSHALSDFQSLSGIKYENEVYYSLIEERNALEEQLKSSTLEKKERRELLQLYREIAREIDELILSELSLWGVVEN